MLHVQSKRFLLQFGYALSAWLEKMEISMYNGFKIPQVVFKVREEQEDGSFKWNTLTTDDMFSNKRVIIVGLPGAFTPVCTDYQLPEYDVNYDQIRNLDIDDIYCVSVNDTFVMNKWAEFLGIENVKMIPDGNAEFTRRIGMLVDKRDKCMGMRSWRYVMIVDDLVVDKVFVEDNMCDNSDEDPYDKTKFNNILKYLKRG
jgi:thioredoxin-dependent peroxiredoxin